MVTRRNLLKGAGVGAAAIATPAAALAADQAATPVLVLYDSRLPESADFAARHGSAQRLDVAQGHATGWADLRTGIPQGTRLEGLTRWSDYAALRLALRGSGLRAGAETPARAPLSGHDGLTRWSLAPRA